MKLKENLQQYNLSVAMPNELFTQLLQMKEDGELKPVHIGFTYSYIYLQTYMYRYSTYDAYVPSKGEIKELLTYNPTEQLTDYIIKKNGLLEQKDILTTTNEFPVISEMEDDGFGNRVPKITTIHEFCNENQHETVDEWRNRMGITRRVDCKYPVFGFERYAEEDEQGVYYEDGTFFDISNSTLIDMDAFLFCMSTDGIGVNGFYVYAYLLDKSNKFNNVFKATYKRIATETGLSEKTIQRVMDALRSHNLITTIHNNEYFSFAISKDKRIPSIHEVNMSADFSANKIEYKKLKFVSNKEHNKLMENTFTSHLIEINIEDLPY
ncbi:helix-turn-helix domain-containing protein [Lysinibacillus sphaericus]|uniref:helix-turn-helix domain-containing protein n=1 Tax=Lysinibacillus sphaericus TaxID=1421 RepID=UPI00055AF775|nr:helix-turn-helix domain-containing protein [Lysinibacillus sphaericus]QTB24550.1 helix-turn-helix domain-containing protein [Lysinibacillus sphaericus]